MKTDKKTSIIGIIWILLVVCVFGGLLYFIHSADPLANQPSINILAFCLIVLPISYVGYYHFFNEEYALIRRERSFLHYISTLIATFYLAINFTDLPTEDFLFFYFCLGIFSLFLFLTMFYKIDKVSNEDMDELIDSIGEEGE